MRGNPKCILVSLSEMRDVLFLFFVLDVAENIKCLSSSVMAFSILGSPKKVSH